MLFAESVSEGVTCNIVILTLSCNDLHLSVRGATAGSPPLSKPRRLRHCVAGGGFVVLTYINALDHASLITLSETLSEALLETLSGR